MKLWIARNRNGNLHLFTDKPEIITNGYYFGANDCIMNNNLFPEVTFENSPQEVELKLV